MSSSQPQVKSNKKFPSSTSILLSLTVMFIILGIIDILPYLCGYKFYYDKNNQKLEKSLESNDYINSVVLVIGLTIPLLLEIIIDIRFIKWNLLLPRILIVCSCLLTHIMFYFSRPSITLFVGLYRARESILAGALITFLFATHHSKYDKYAGCALLITGVSYNVFITWGDLETSSAVAVITAIFRILLAIELLTLCLWYASIVSHERSEIMSSTSKKLTLIYAIILALFFFLIFIVWFAFGAQPWKNIGLAELVVYNLIEACAMLGAIIIPARLTRFETHSNEIELIRKRIFVRYVSHEVRTPLHAISVGLELATSTLNSIEKSFHSSQGNSCSSLLDGIEGLNVVHSLQSLVSDISLSCSSSIDILDDLLLFDDIERGNISLRKQCVPLTQCVERWANPFRLQAQHSSITFLYQQVDLQLYVEIDLVKIAQAFRNILNNAFEHTPQGGSITIRTSHLYKDVGEEHEIGFARIEIIDTGRGIPEAQQRYLFEDHNRLDSNELSTFQPAVPSDRKSGAPGLGLYLAAVIIREHGGNIGVTSSGIPGEGSIFSIELRTTDSSTAPSLLTPQPVQSPIESGETKLHDRQRHSAKVSPKIEVESSNHQYRRALIVDDSHVVRKMLAKSITNQFLFIEHANDGVEAVNIVKRLMNEGETINVIFLDSFMPNMGGIEACKYIRTLGYVGLIIAISGNVIQEDINEFLAAGADHFIGKPFKLEQLQAVLSEFSSRLANPIENVPQSTWAKRVQQIENAMTPKYGSSEKSYRY